MNWLKRLFFAPRPATRFYTFQVRCNRCGETLEGRIDLHNDPSPEYEGEQTYYICRKVLIGSGPCYQAIETEFRLDENRRVLERKVYGGTFVDGDEA